MGQQEAVCTCNCMVTVKMEERGIDQTSSRCHRHMQSPSHPKKTLIV